MQAQGLRRLVVLLPLFWFAATNAASAQPRAVINGFDAESPPFAYLDDADSPAGFDIEALNRIAEIEGFQISHQSEVFDELIPTLQGEYAEDGEVIDMIDSGFAITPEREAQVSFTMPYLQIQKVLLVRGDSNLTPEELLSQGQTIAVRDGSTEADWIDAHLILQENRAINLYYYDGYDEMVDDLEDEAVAAVVMDEATARRYAHSDGLKIAGPLPMPPEQVGFAVRKDDTELLSLLNDGLRQLMGSPEWEGLKRKYGLS